MYPNALILDKTSIAGVRSHLTASKWLRCVRAIPMASASVGIIAVAGHLHRSIRLRCKVSGAFHREELVNVLHSGDHRRPVIPSIPCERLTHQSLNIFFCISTRPSSSFSSLTLHLRHYLACDKIAKSEQRRATLTAPNSNSSYL